MLSSAEKTFIQFVKAREDARCKKEAGEVYTGDPIIEKYRFCNVHREDDKVTKWIAKHWRDPYQYDKNLWFAMVVARLFNLPSTLDTIGYPHKFNRELWRKKLKSVQSAGTKVFNGAYIVSTCGVRMSKVDYVLDWILEPLWQARDHIAPKPATQLCMWHEAIVDEFNGIGSFIAAQVVADFKYASPYTTCPDWWTFAKSGPGSRRGLNRILGRPVNKGWTENAWKAELVEFIDRVQYEVEEIIGKTHAQDYQNCLCEFDKYERARLGEGRPKQLYRGGVVK